MRRLMIVLALVVAYAAVIVLFTLFDMTVVRAQSQSIFRVGGAYQSSGFACRTQAHADALVEAHVQGEAQGDAAANALIASQVCGNFQALAYVVVEIGRTANVTLDGATYPLSVVVIAPPQNREIHLFMLTINPVERDQAAK